MWSFATSVASQAPYHWLGYHESVIWCECWSQLVFNFVLSFKLRKCIHNSMCTTNDKIKSRRESNKGAYNNKIMRSGAKES